MVKEHNLIWDEGEFAPILPRSPPIHHFLHHHRHWSWLSWFLLPPQATLWVSFCHSQDRPCQHHHALFFLKLITLTLVSAGRGVGSFPAPSRELDPPVPSMISRPSRCSKSSILMSMTRSSCLSRLTLSRERPWKLLQAPSQAPAQSFRVMRPNLSNISQVKRILLGINGGSIPAGCAPLTSRRSRQMLISPAGSPSGDHGFNRCSARILSPISPEHWAVTTPGGFTHKTLNSSASQPLCRNSPVGAHHVPVLELCGMLNDPWYRRMRRTSLCP